MTEPINTKKVIDRRHLHFNGLEDILADVEQLAAGSSVRPLGNWSAGQVLAHLATVMEKSVDGFDNRLPAVVQFVARLFVKCWALTKPAPAGYKLSGKIKTELEPGTTNWEDGLDRIRRAIGRLQTETQRAPHPMLGRLTMDEWNQLHCRHAELHLSFLTPYP